MERRVLLAISLSFAVLFLYQALVVPPPRPSEDPTNVTAPPPAATPDPTLGAAPPLAGSLTPGNTTAPAPAPLPAASAIVGDTEERQIVLESPHVRAAFTNRGGRLRHWVLKEYLNDLGEPIDLVPEIVPPDLPLPFSLRVDDPAASQRLNEALYQVSQPDDGTVVFAFEGEDGLRARKTFTLDPDTFIVSFTAHVQQGDQVLNPVVQWGPGMTDEIARTERGSFLSPSFIYHAQAIYHPLADSVEREAATGLFPTAVREGEYRWAGVDDHYFISAVLHPPAPLRLEYQPVSIPTPTSPPQVGQYVSYSVRFPAPPEQVRFYVGPKQLDVMRSIDPEFTRAIYFGIFAWLAAPLLDALRWVYGYVGSWGWSIIVLTIIINFVMFPLRHKSVVSMRKMQELQPQMKAIQERYAKYKITDPERQKMNQEVMELYRTKGVNPASGCVPMLITLPFLFAFYSMLSQAIEIRGQSFWWIPDLALRDPWYIVPLFMGLTMFWQQRLMPTTADPTQQKIMMFMPVMITVTMLFAPSGLVIYWLVSNVWAIGQQYFTNWLIGPPKVPAPAPAKARPAKAGRPARAGEVPRSAEARKN